MTSFGGYTAGSQETRGLKAIDSSKYNYVNKDFVKNMQRLNQATDYMSSYMQTMQKGIDDANANAIEQIQSFAADLFVLFAGLEPTGIEIGDLKYVIQGIGALLGINPDTPFPVSVIEMAQHMLTEYLIPLPQFSDVIFDAILAWAVDLGLSEDFIESVKHLRDSLEGIFGSIDDLVEILTGLFNIFGITDILSLNGFADLFASIVNIAANLLDNPVVGDVIEYITDVVAPFIEAAAGILDFASGTISAGQISEEGQEIVPPVAASTITWNVSGDANTGWVFDPSQSADSVTGSFRANANGTAKEIHSQVIFPCKPNDKFNVKGQIKWSGVPTGSNAFGIGLALYNNETFEQSVLIPIAGGHGASGGFSELASQVTVPNLPDINGFRIIGYVGTAFNTGQVWVDKLSAKKFGKISVNLIDGLVDMLSGFLPIDFFDDIIGIPGADASDIISYFANFITGDSPLDANNLFNLGNLFGNLPIGHLSLDQPELLDDPTFRSAIAIQGGGTWTWDGANGRTVPGCVSVNASGALNQLVSNSIKVSEGDKLNPLIYAKWSGLVYTGTKPIKLQFVRLMYNSITETFATMGFDEIAAPASPPGTQGAWQLFSAPYTVPANCTHVVLQLVVDTNATAGTVKWDDASVKKSGLIEIPWVDQLPDELQFLTDFGQGIVDGLANAWGLLGSGFELEDLLDIATAIPFDNIIGLGGVNNIGQNIQDLIDSGVQGILGGIGTGYSFFDWKDALGFIPPTNVVGVENSNMQTTVKNMWDFVTSGLKLDSLFGVGLPDFAGAAQDVSFTSLNSGILSGAHEVVLGYRTNNPIDGALERTAVSNFNWTLLQNPAAPTVPYNFAVTQANSVMGVLRMKNSDTKGTIFWRSITSGTVSEFYINVGKINDTTGAVDHIYQTPNIVSSLTTSWNWNYYQPPEVDRIVHAEDDGLLIEFIVVGTGTVTMAGIDFAMAADNFPGAITRKPGATRATAGAHPTLALSTAQYTAALTTKTPWFALGRADVPLTYHPPENWEYTNSGAWVYPIPVWARVYGTLIDYWLLGAGGGGQSGGYFAVSGEGGMGGNWTSGTLVYGVDIPMGTTQLTGNNAAESNGGLNAFALEVGDNGGSTTMNGIGGGFSTKTATGGAGGGRAGNTGGSGGKSPGNRTVAGHTRYGGAAVAVNQDGNYPGGGGGGGYPAFGHNGRKGYAGFRARQP